MCCMLSSSRSPKFQSNIFREITDQEKSICIVIEIVKLASFLIFLLQWLFFINNLSKALFCNTQRWLVFYSYILFLLKYFSDVFFFIHTHLNLQFQKGNSCKIYILHAFYILKNQLDFFEAQGV